jgi:two-component system nitrate/nitrite response regulator NarL
MEKKILVIASAVGESRRRWVQKLRKFSAICEVAQGKALKQVVANLRPDVLVVDLSLPQLGRVRGLPDIQEACPTTKMLVLTDIPAQIEAIAALKAGAKGYSSRFIDPAQLMKAVQVIQDGEIWIPRRLVPVLVSEMVSVTQCRERDLAVDRDLESLTERQRVVADLLSRGACNKEIAAKLNISERTVKAHLTRAFRRFGVSDRLELALRLNAPAGTPALYKRSGSTR